MLKKLFAIISPPEREEKDKNEKQIIAVCTTFRFGIVIATGNATG
jgi:hypothetical protein